MSDEAGKRVDDGSNWFWWTAGILLFLAYCNYYGPDQRSAPNDATSGMSYEQASAYRDCMEASRGYNLSDYAQSDICRKSALGYGGSTTCRTEWDGHANASLCE